MNKLFFLLILLICFLFTSCDTSDKFVTPTLSAPVVPGIFVTDCDGSYWGTWLEPYSPCFEFPGNENISHFTLSCSVFPNPDNGQSHIQFSIPYEGDVKITVVPALPPGSDPTIPVINNNVSNLAVIEGSPIRTLLNEPLILNYYQIIWDGRDDFGDKVPDGFYRIFVEFDEYLVWCDLLFLTDPNNLPPGMILPFSEWG